MKLFNKILHTKNICMSHIASRVAAFGEKYSELAVNVAITVAFFDLQQMALPEFMNTYPLVGLRLKGNLL